MPFVILRRVAPPTSSRRATRYSSGVVPLSGSMFFGLPMATHLPSTSMPYTIPSTTRISPPGRLIREGASLERVRSPSFQRIVLSAQTSPSWVIRTTAVPERSAEAAVRVAAFSKAAGCALDTGRADGAERNHCRRQPQAPPRPRRGPRLGDAAGRAVVRCRPQRRSRCAPRRRRPRPTLRSPSWARGLALRRASKLSGMLMDPPLGNRLVRGFAAVSVLEDGPESTPRAMQSSACRHRETTHDVRDLRRRQALPLGQEKNLPVTCGRGGEARRAQRPAPGQLTPGEPRRPPEQAAPGARSAADSRAAGSRSLASPSRTARRAPHHLPATRPDAATP